MHNVYLKTHIVSGFFQLVCKYVVINGTLCYVNKHCHSKKILHYRLCNVLRQRKNKSKLKQHLKHKQMPDLIILV